jgi:uncharacterized phiE125 gp8 family phage protein
VPAIDIGDPLPNLAVRVENPPGTLVDVGTMVLTVTAPSGTATVVPNTRTALGLYSATAPHFATEGGLYRARWVATGANACVKEQLYSVGDPVDIDDVRKAVKVSGTATDDVLYACIAAATAYVERESGRALRQRTLTDVRAGGKYAVALSQVPVGTVLAVSENGSALVPADYTVNPQTGLLYRGSGRGGATWAAGPTAVVVQYTTSSAPVPDNLRQAIVEGIRHLVGRFRGSTGQPAAGPIPTDDMPAIVDTLIGARIPRF